MLGIVGDFIALLLAANAGSAAPPASAGISCARLPPSGRLNGAAARTGRAAAGAVEGRRRRDQERETASGHRAAANADAVRHRDRTFGKLQTCGEFTDGHRRFLINGGLG